MTITAIIHDIVEEMRDVRERGALPSYIPPLTTVDPHKFGIAVLEANGRVHVAGDADEAFSIQSISKVHALALAMECVGEGLWSRVRQEPSGSAFNSIVQLESEQGIPRNPFINAGALVVSDMLVSHFGATSARLATLGFVRALVGTGSCVEVDDNMAFEEYKTGYRNAALANYMRTYRNIMNPIDVVLGQYFHQCALTMSCRQLAATGRFLIMGGCEAIGTFPAISKRTAQTVLALMMTCGHYDGSGSFAVRVGLPGKSGVGGGILAVVPGIATVSVWSPGLNAQGNSLLGTLALERLVQLTGWSVFSGTPRSTP